MIYIAMTTDVTIATNISIVDYEQIVKLSDDFNGADLRNVCTEAGQW